jgi:NADH-quinone oxidoreductase subunit L
LVELSLGMWNLVLIHFMGNAFLRCFQLLVSSSIVAEQLQIQSALVGIQLKQRWSIESWIPKSLRSTLYVFALNEGYLEAIMNRVLARNVARLAKLANTAVHLWDADKALSPATVTFRSTSWFPVLAIALYGTNLIFGPVALIPFLFLGLSVFLSLNGFGEEKSPMAAIRSACFSHLALLLALTVNHPDMRASSLFYLVGFGASWFLVYDAYSFVLRRRIVNAKNRFEGLFAQFPIASMIGLVGILGLLGFPLATTFFAEDLLLEHAVNLGSIFIIVPVIIFILNGLALMRLHTRLFFGCRDLENCELNMDFSSSRAFSRLALFAAMNVLAFILV